MASTRTSTVSNGVLSASVQNDGASIIDARIRAADIDASDGVIHVIDAVLLPGS